MCVIHLKTRESFLCRSFRGMGDSLRFHAIDQKRLTYRKAICWQTQTEERDFFCVSPQKNNLQLIQESSRTGGFKITIMTLTIIEESEPDLCSLSFLVAELAFTPSIPRYLMLQFHTLADNLLSLSSQTVPSMKGQNPKRIYIHPQTAEVDFV